MSLNIIAVVAGIAGLVVAASSLQQAGKRVVVLEKSSLSTVVGAALHVNPNSGRVLAHLGFDAVATPGHPEPGMLVVHRADLHQALLRLAIKNEAEEDTSWGPLNNGRRRHRRAQAGPDDLVRPLRLKRSEDHHSVQRHPALAPFHLRSASHMGL
ncbi:uncharacterized protein Z519_10624 [Cladophialophora bantiana CBS 173.52]|uniref:FAD-binding domain-containing protein n=1 Tax=Cladophialophora bantiana (strain ATCC 10958 / CBS 173.52 / CDC B-1940 / NIH 8579) TaxID=1442370 RepID=A0A0D2H5L3_CLAB1|nr:uncharacterized protein Z519_10624 [Cladophialophora bantiana CBS 173.52]KIW88578.1 hypothetical protein Z519_10624 [Cladophialophora bantiana CBS 173.52]